MDAARAVSSGGRAEAMAARIADTARHAGVPEAGVHSVLAALDAAMHPRIEHLDDDHHPDYLHPGRTVLILLEDVGVVDPATLSAGALAETLREELAVRPWREARDAPPARPSSDRLAPGTLEILAEVPHLWDDPDTLLERLIAAPETARLVALAERLDHVRHLHLHERAMWDDVHRDTCQLYLPVAERTHEVLARRLQWWCNTFARRFLHVGNDPVGNL